MRVLIYLILCLAITSCSDDINESFATCDLIKNQEVMTKEEAEQACIRYDVYELDGKLYTTCICCLCNKVPTIQDCNGEQYCDDFNSDCTDSFYREATYQFSLRSL